MNFCRRTLLAAALILCASKQLPAQQVIPKGGSVPVVLINGWATLCSASATSNNITDASAYFGGLPAFLGNTGYTMLFFNTCQYGDVSIESIGASFGLFLSNLKYDDGSAVSQVDVVAFSMGGLVARSYLAGKATTSGVFNPPAKPGIRKLVLIATPNFGASSAEPTHGLQEAQMVPGSQFLWDLGTWNQNTDDLRGTDAIAIVGNAGTTGGATGGSDGFVSLTSSSIGFTRPDVRTRIIPYCHITSSTAPAGFPLNCTGPGIAQIDTQTHLTFLILQAFLAGFSNWQTVGGSPSQDLFLSQAGGIGGVVMTLKNADDTYAKDISRGDYDCAGTKCSGHLSNGPSAAVASILTNDVVQLGQRNFLLTHADGTTTTQTGTVAAGFTTAFPFKLGPAITTVTSANSTGLAGTTVSGNSNITINGTGFKPATGTTTVFANGTALTTSAITDTQITAFLPGNYNGLVQLKVSNPNGQNTVNIVTASPSPVMTITSVQNGGSGAAGAIAPGEIVSIKGSLLGPSTGVSFSINNAGGVDTTLGGVQVHFGSVAAPITYASATQINAIVPYEVLGQTSPVTMKVDYNGLSATTSLQVAATAPGIFTFNATGTGQAIAANIADGTFNGPDHPAQRGQYVTVYFTGGGVTIPAGATGSVNSGTTLKYLANTPIVTVADRPAVVSFAGAAPTLVDGVMQMNIQLDAATPPGSAQQLVIKFADSTSPATATLAVQ